MELKDLFKAKSSFFKQDLKSKEEVIDFLSKELSKVKIVNNEEAFKKAILKRESQDSTGIGDGIAIPHALDKSVSEATIAFVSLKNPIDWQSLDDKPVDLIFMISTSGEDGGEHLGALSELSTYLMKAENLEKLRSAKTMADLNKVFAPVKKEEVKLADGRHYDVIGITACPTGIAHTYMAAEKLVETAKELGMTVKIETQGRRGVEDKLTEEDIKNAKVIILGHDKQLEGLGRFNGVEVIDTSTKDVIYHAKDLIEGFSTNDKKTVIKASANSSEDSGEFTLKKFWDFKGNLLAGVSRMLPFVVAGGIILGLGFLIEFAAGEPGGGNFGTQNAAAGWFTAIGKTAMTAMVPILGAYIAYALVGPQGLMPGFVAGMFADNTGGFVYGDHSTNAWGGLWQTLFPNANDLHFQSGFIGAMVGAYLAGFIVFGLTKMMKKMPKSFAGVRDIVFIPVLSLLAIALTMFVMNIPLGYLMFGIQEGLKWLAQHNVMVLVTVLLALMMCIDMGGPINKIAYVLGTMTVGGQLIIMVNGEDQSTILMAAAMAGGMVPPLGIAIATVFFPKTWTAKERDAAKVNWVMGAFFITEGAIPFMVTDPKRVSVSGLTGGAVTGLIIGLLEVKIGAPHGGVFVLPLAKSLLFDNEGIALAMGIVFFLAAVAAGAFTMAFILGFWKQRDIRKGKLVVDNGFVAKDKKVKAIKTKKEKVSATK